MPEQYRNDLHAQSCSNHLLASTKMLSKLPVSRGCKFTAERRRRRAPIAASCSGLTQQGLPPLYAPHRALIPGNSPQHALHTPVQRSQRPSPVHGRDVRAFIRAPVIPALEAQPYREGEDKASQLQVGTCMYSIVWIPYRHLHAATCSPLWLSAAAGLCALLTDAALKYDEELRITCSTPPDAEVAELVHNRAAASSQYSSLSQA